MAIDAVFEKLMDLGVDSRVGKVIYRELTQGNHLYKAHENKRLRGAAEEAQYLKDIKKAHALFKPVSSMPARDFFYLRDKYGHDEVMSREFHRYMHKKIPETKISNV